MNVQPVELIELEQVVAERDSGPAGDECAVGIVGEGRAGGATRARAAGQAGPRHSAGPAAPEAQPGRANVGQGHLAADFANVRPATTQVGGGGIDGPVPARDRHGLGTGPVERQVAVPGDDGREAAGAVVQVERAQRGPAEGERGVGRDENVVQEQGRVVRQHHQCAVLDQISRRVAALPRGQHQGRQGAPGRDDLRLVQMSRIVQHDPDAAVFAADGGGFPGRVDGRQGGWLLAGVDRLRDRRQRNWAWRLRRRQQRDPVA